MPPKLTEPNEPSTFMGMEIFDTAFVGMATYPIEVRYNGVMNEDDETIIELGIPSSPANYMRVGVSADGRTQVDFIYRWQYTDGTYHGQIASQALLDNRNLPGLIQLLQDRLKKLEQ